MAGPATRIPQRATPEKPIVIGIIAQPLADHSSQHWIDAATPTDYSGLLRPLFDATNTVSWLSISTSLPRPARVDRGVEYSIAHYEDLLRRLAD